MSSLFTFVKKWEQSIIIFSLKKSCFLKSALLVNFLILLLTSCTIYMFCVSPWPLCVHSEYISLLGNPNRYRPLPIRALLDIGQPWSLTVNAYTLWNVTSTQAKARTQTLSETYEWGFERDCTPMCYLSYLFRIIVYFQILGTL